MVNSDLKANLIGLVERIGDIFGSECTAAGKVSETKAGTIDDAIAEFVEASKSDPDDAYESIKQCLAECGRDGEDDGPGRIVVQLRDFEKFKKPFDDEDDLDEDYLEPLASLKELVALIEPFKPAYAMAGDKYLEDNDSVLSYHCLLVVSNDGSGTNFLLTFPQVRT